MTLWPQRFGLADSAQAVRLSFVLVAVWWAVFTIPLVLFVSESRRPDRASGRAAVAAGLRQLAATARQLRQLRAVWLFLLAYWCYIDGVYTIARMAVDYGMALGFDPQQPDRCASHHPVRRLSRGHCVRPCRRAVWRKARHLHRHRRLRRCDGVELFHDAKCGSSTRWRR